MPSIHPIADQPVPYADHLGLKIVSAAPDRIVARLVATANLLNRNGTLHGGAVMGCADHLGGMGAFLNIKPGESTATVESKTNFLRGVPAGDTLEAVSVPLHIGGMTMVWQTTLARSDGKVAAIVTQTQITLKDPKFPKRA